MAENKKLTKKDYFKEIIEIATECGRNDIVDFANHEIELLTKKNTSKGLTKNQKENEDIKKVIISVMEDMARPVTIGELAKTEELNAYSANKISALVKQLKDSEVVTRTEDKKVAYFSLN